MITVHAAWNAATQEWEGTSEDLPELRVRARTLEELRQRIAGLLDPDQKMPFRLIALARNQTPKRTLH